MAGVGGDETEEEEVECGSVWMIAQVEETKSEWKRVEGGNNKNRCVCE